MSGLLVDDPVKMMYALASADSVIPGDVLRLRGGTYRGDFVVSFQGTEAAPIQIRPYNGEAVIIDGGLQLNNYVELFDVDIVNSRPNRVGIANGLNNSYPGASVYGCYIHDTLNSGVSWWGSGVGEVCENVIIHNGYYDEGGAGHAHAVYSHNNQGGLRLMARNFMHDQIGEYTVHLYSGGDNMLQDYTIEDNVIAGDRIHMGGGLGLKNVIFRNNVHFGDYSQIGVYLRPLGHNYSLTISGNHFIDTNMTITDDFDTLVQENNIVWGLYWYNAVPGYEIQEKPATWSKWVACTKSTRWLGGLTVYNRDSAEAANVDLSAALVAGSYRLRNTQKMTEVWAFEYVTGNVAVPMTIWSATDISGGHPSTYPVLGTFIVEAA